MVWPLNFTTIKKEACNEAFAALPCYYEVASRDGVRTWNHSHLSKTPGDFRLKSQLSPSAQHSKARHAQRPGSLYCVVLFHHNTVMSETTCSSGFLLRRRTLRRRHLKGLPRLPASSLLLVRLPSFLAVLLATLLHALSNLPGADTATYYVSSTAGADTNDGLSLGAPFLSLQKCVDAMESLGALLKTVFRSLT